MLNKTTVCPKLRNKHLPAYYKKRVYKKARLYNGNGQRKFCKSNLPLWQVRNYNCSFETIHVEGQHVHVFINPLLLANIHHMQCLHVSASSEHGLVVGKALSPHSLSLAPGTNLWQIFTYFNVAVNITECIKLHFIPTTSHHKTTAGSSCHGSFICIPFDRVHMLGRCSGLSMPETVPNSYRFLFLRP